VTTSSWLLARQPRQPLADRARHRAADAAIDLVEDHGRGAALFGQRDLEREDEARQLAARRDLGQRTERCAGIGRDFELDPVAAGRPGSPAAHHRPEAARLRA
jgi:NAD(P)-dependent dehydrogenase (short-subunit alcohol dehydrogenase family)